jgi:hypothetical protein
MSRKIVPRRVCDPVQIVPERQQIPHAQSCQRGDESEFIAGLERCAGNFLWLRNQYRTRKASRRLAASASPCEQAP